MKNYIEQINTSVLLNISNYNKRLYLETDNKTFLYYNNYNPSSPTLKNSIRLECQPFYRGIDNFIFAISYYYMNIIYTYEFFDDNIRITLSNINDDKIIKENFIYNDNFMFTDENKFNLELYLGSNLNFLVEYSVLYNLRQSLKKYDSFKSVITHLYIYNIRDLNSINQIINIFSDNL